MVDRMSFSTFRSAGAFGVLLAGLWLAGCASQGQPYNGYRSSNAYDPYYDDYYGRQPEYIIIDREAERLEHHQRRETKELEHEQKVEKRALQQDQKAEREALKDAGEWDKQDRIEQKQERKEQKRVFKEEDRALRKHQKQEWKNF
jgi:hypothetical protein